MASSEERGAPRTLHDDQAEYLLLCADQLMLILSQSAVGSVRHLGDDEIEQVHNVGRVLQCNSNRDGKTTWFAALSDELTLLPTLPKERFLLTTFVAYPDIHWCWRELYQMSGNACERFALPAIICTPATPVHALAVFGKQRRAFFTSAEDIVRFALQGKS